MSPPLVTIVIPNFNQGRYLPACVDHCLFQTYPNIEIIIVDGGSTDTTKSYLATLKECVATTTMDPVLSMSEQGDIIRVETRIYPQNRRLHILSFDADIGATRTYNVGFEKAAGKYCTYIPGDDLPHPHMIEEMVEILENDDVDFVYSDMHVVDDAGGIVRQMRLPDYSFEACLAKWFHLGVSKLYRSALHTDVGLMDETYKSANDYDHYLRFAMSGARFRHLPKVLYSIRFHGQDRKTGQHTDLNYQRLLDESIMCAQRARQWMAAKENGSKVT